MVPKCATAEDLVKAIKDEKVQMIDLRFTDLPGGWQHFSVPPSAVNVDALNEGIGFDGSSIRGFQEIQGKRHARHRRSDDGLRRPL
ncbi:glutamine synthetase [Bradyrhizobium sp. LM2.7]